MVRGKRTTLNDALNECSRGWESANCFIKQFTDSHRRSTNRDAEARLASRNLLATHHPRTHAQDISRPISVSRRSIVEGLGSAEAGDTENGEMHE